MVLCTYCAVPEEAPCADAFPTTTSWAFADAELAAATAPQERVTPIELADTDVTRRPSPVRLFLTTSPGRKTVFPSPAVTVGDVAAEVADAAMADTLPCSSSSSHVTFSRIAGLVPIFSRSSLNCW